MNNLDGLYHRRENDVSGADDNEADIVNFEVSPVIGTLFTRICGICGERLPLEAE